MNSFALYVTLFLKLEVGIIILFVLFAYAAKLNQYFKARVHSAKRLKLRRIIQRVSQKGRSFSLKEFRHFKREIHFTLDMIAEFDESIIRPINWEDLKQSLIANSLLPKARVYALSKNMYRRYLAIQCFQYGPLATDEASIIRLMHDKILLISLNAARIAFKFPSIGLINSMIDAFSQGRRLQQSVYAYAIHDETSNQIVPIIEERLTEEKNPYTKAFCYRLLLQFPSTLLIVPSAEQDIESEVLDLKLAVINYLAHQNQQNSVSIIRKFANDSHWEVRAAVVRLLGVLNDSSSIGNIGEKLKDKEWWVRFRAAEALAALGQKGIDILKEQDPKSDRYAHEVAELILKRNANDAILREHHNE